MSPYGLRIERPYTGGPTRREVPLQIEVPRASTRMMWAKGAASFDVLVPAEGPGGGARGEVRRPGYGIDAAPCRDLRMLKEFVIESDRAHRRDHVAHQRALGLDLGFSRLRYQRAVATVEIEVRVDFAMRS